MIQEASRAAREAARKRKATRAALPNDRADSLVHFVACRTGNPYHSPNRVQTLARAEIKSFMK